MMQGWYYVESLTGQWHDRVQTESQIATVDSCFDLIGSLQHGVASCEVCSWLTDIHKPTKCRWWWPQMKLKSKSLPTEQCHMQNAWQGTIGQFSCGTVCLSAVYLSRQWHDILDFSNCPLSRVLHVTLFNWQGFGFEFHLGSSPSAFSGFVNISQPAAYFTACYTVLKRPNKVETAVHGCNLAFSLDSIVSLPR